MLQRIHILSQLDGLCYMKMIITDRRRGSTSSNMACPPEKPWSGPMYSRKGLVNISSPSARPQVVCALALPGLGTEQTLLAPQQQIQGLVEYRQTHTAENLVHAHSGSRPQQCMDTSILVHKKTYSAQTFKLVSRAYVV